MEGSTKKLSEEQVRDLITQYFDTYNKADWELVGTRFYTEDVLFEAPEYEFIGREKTIDFFKRVHLKLKETMTALRILTDGQHIAIRILVELNALEDFPDFHVRPLTKGEIMRFELGAFYEIKDEKISHVKIYRFRN